MGGGGITHFQLKTFIKYIQQASPLDIAYKKLSPIFKFFIVFASELKNKAAASNSTTSEWHILCYIYKYETY